MNQDNILAKVTAVRDDLASNLLERGDAIEGSLLALLTREHLLLLGPPGTAKSMLARGICERIDAAVLFSYQLDRFATPEALFGPLSLSSLEQDRYQRITTGTIVEADIAFLDEVFKANSAILNSLLSLINERVYFEAGRAIKAPLLSLIGASNETPEDAGLDAIYDRFLLRVQVPYLADEDSVRQLFDLANKQPSATITLDELRIAQAEVDAVPLTDEARDAIITIKHELESEGIGVSDRRWKSCARLVRAKAWMEGSAQTTTDHCDCLVHALWHEPSQIRAVERVVNKVANPLNLEAVELEDAAEDLYKQRPDIDHPNLTEALGPLLKQLGDVSERLHQRIANAPEKRSARARQALNRVETWHRALSQLALKSLSQLHMAPGAA